MILTSHILSGAVLGEKIQNPWVVAGIAIAFHFCLDLVPHGDYLNKKSKNWDFWKVAVDLFIGLGIVFLILYFRISPDIDLKNIAIGIFFSLLPDGTTLLYWKMGMKFLRPIFDLHQKLHHFNHADFAPERDFRLKNNLGDIVVSLLSILLLIIS
jgi:hypothetical protein